MLSAVVQPLQRLPTPLLTPLPMIFTVLGPGLLLWVLAFHLPVHYPQETMAPYPDTSPATMELGHPQAPTTTSSVAGNAKTDQHPLLKSRNAFERHV